MSAQTVEINSVDTVLRELAPLVEEVQRTLEQSLESDDPATGADGVTPRLREIRGTLELLDLDGPTLLVDEMRALATALSGRQVEHPEPGLEVLLKGIFKLPDYLDRIRSGRRDRPAVLLPLINELRNARGDQPLTERDVFRPELEPVASTGTAGVGAQDDGTLQATAKRLRPRFQRALLGWYRGEDIEHSLDQLGSVLQELAQATANPATQRLWRVCGALTESLSDQGLEQDRNVKVLMARVERLLSQLVRQGEGALERTIPLDLLRSLLYYVARSGSDSPRVQEVKQAYQLEELLPGSGAEADFEGPNRALLEVVGQGIRDDLASIRDAVEIYVHSEERRPHVLEGLPDRLKQVADTFSMVGLSHTHEVLRREADALAEIDSLGTGEADQRMQTLADVLVRADSDLTALETGRPVHASASDTGALAIRDLPDSEYRPLLSAVIAAALDDLSKLREAIGAYCGDPETGRDALAEAPTLLSELEGALAMLPLESAVPLVRNLRRYIETELVERRMHPDDHTQVLIADVVAGLEYYLEAVDHDRAAMTHLLEGASRAIAALATGGEPVTHSEDEQVVIASSEPAAAADAELGDVGDEAAAEGPVGSADQDEGFDVAELELDEDALPADAGEREAAPAPESESVDALDRDALDAGGLELESPDDTGAGVPEAADDAAAASGGVEVGPVDDPADDLELEGLELDGADDSADLKAGGPRQMSDDTTADGGDGGLEVDLATDEPDAAVGAALDPDGPNSGEASASDPGVPGQAGDVAADPGDSETSAAGQHALTAGEGERPAAGVDPASSGSQYAIVGEDVDDEIVEVFLEEALGELDKINEYLPKWKANPSDEDALVVVRRAFHTLKGGGRLIGAELVGEFSWSMENMLNRVIDHTIDATSLLFDTLDESAAALPQLIEQIRGNRSPISGIDHLIQRAHALSRGEEPPPGGGSGPSEPSPVSGGAGATDTAPSAGVEQGDRGAEPSGDAAASPEARTANDPARSDDAMAADRNHGDTISEPESSVDADDALGVPDGDAPGGNDASPLEASADADQAPSRDTANPGLDDDDPLAPDVGDLDILGAGTDGHANEAQAEVPLRADAGATTGPAPSQQEPAPHATDAGVDPTAVDDELITTLLSEGDDITEALDGAVDRWRTHPDDPAVVVEIQRHLHTLKGCARMADLAPLGELSHALEMLVSAGEEGTCELGQRFFDTLREGVDALSAMLARVRSSQALQPAAHILEQVHGLCGTAASPQPGGATDEAASGHPAGAAGDESAADAAEVTEATTIARPAFDEGDIDLEAPEPAALDADEATAIDPPDSEETNATGAVGADASGDAGAHSGDVEVDGELIDSFLEEADELIETCDEAVARWRNNPEDADAPTQLQRALHTLKGGARMADLEGLGVLAHELEALLHAVDQGTCERNEALFDGLQEAVDAFSSMLAEARAGQALSPQQELIQRIESLRHGSVPGADANATVTTPVAGAEPTPGGDALEPISDVTPGADEAPTAAPPAAGGEAAGDSLVAVFAREAESHQTVLRGAYLDAYGQSLHEAQPADTQALRALHTLAGSAETAGCDDIAAVAAPMEDLLKHRRDARTDLSSDDVAALGEAVRLLDRMLAHLRGEADPVEGVDPVRQQIDAQCHKAKAELDATYDEGGDELVDVFLEEADELLEACEQGVARWRERPGDPAITSELQRSLHTLKGGARMAHLPPIADLTHEVESLVRAVEEGSCQISEELFDLLQEAVDALTVLLEQVRGRQPIARVDWLLEDLQNFRERGASPANAAQASVAAEAQASSESTSVAPQANEDGEAGASPEGATPEVAAGEGSEAATGAEPSRGDVGAEAQGQGSAGASSQSTAEQIRVRSDLLDNLVNYAGEVSIYHSRLGEQMGQYRFNLNEFEQTVNRLREQLRQMEDETEAQILYSGEKEQEEQPRREDFDPLEFDRYTRIQELSRSLAESVGDLDSIKEILENLTRDAETLLTQQSRVSSELQDGLMQTRMVRFDGLRARLSRVVRQTASQVGKKAQMTMTGGELEVDRSIQERVVAPLEHVLRNAVSHGIESPAERRRNGKPEQGTISLDLHRGGTDVVLEISDDGSGIDPDAVRQQAIKRGLITPDDERDDNEVIKLILETGFTTAEEVTQISGRGVGMDVVDAEIRRLGGTLGISTVSGQGTRFTIRLPVTLAINQAVLVKAGEDTYAIPIASIEGVTQVTAGDLKQYYIDRAKRLTYAEAEYRVQHLGTLLGTAEPKLDDPETTYPVIMVRAGDDRVALHVDDIQGRREVVVKPLGTPLNMLPGISGATIMADGSVVLILDIGGLLRTESRFVAATAPSEVEPAQPAEAATVEAGEAVEATPGTPTVLVVDDSITMRKVSDRILTRNGLKVATAKDGVEAMSWMAQEVPDVILLDIEMPRMDGYEVASNVRSDERLKDVPIIMVTSRTGDKHRQRAEDVGVNQYLGKPYQEGELMDEINALIGRTETA